MGSRIAEAGVYLSTECRERSGWPCCVAATIAAATVATLLAVGVPVLADESANDVVAVTPGTSYVRSTPAGWNAATRVDDAGEKMPRPKSALTIRVYDGFARLRPFYGARSATGVNVTAELETCADGNARISVLDIGGWLFTVDGDCAGERLGTTIPALPVDNESKDEENQAGTPELRCDPATWRCRTVER